MRKSGANATTAATTIRIAIVGGVLGLAIIAWLGGMGRLDGRNADRGTADNQLPDTTGRQDLETSVILGIQRLANGDTAAAISYALDRSEIVQITPDGRIRWRSDTTHGLNLKWAHSVQHLAQSDTFLIADTGNNRVIEIDRASRIVWRYENPGLLYPNDADRLPDGRTLITVRDADLVVEVTRDGTAAWFFRGVSGPHNADRLANGHTLIANSMQHRIVEVDRNGAVVWEFRDGLRWPRDADRLGNGHTLIADTGNARVIEVDPTGRIAWQFAPAPMVYDADRLANGHTLVSLNPRDGGRIVEVDPTGRMVWQWQAPLSPFHRAGLALREFIRPATVERDVLAVMRACRDHGATFADLAPAAERLTAARTARRLGDHETWQAELLRARDALVHLNRHQKRTVPTDETAVPTDESGDESGFVAGRIVGIVRDSAGAPILDGDVFLIGTRHHTRTGSDGRFALVEIPRMRYGLAVRKPGFAPAWHPDVTPIPAATPAAEAEISVTLTPIEAEPMRDEWLVLRAAAIVALTPSAVEPPSPPTPATTSTSTTSFMRGDGPWPTEAQPWLAPARPSANDCRVAQAVRRIGASIDRTAPQAAADATTFVRATVAWMAEHIWLDAPTRFPFDVSGHGWQRQFGRVSRGPMDRTRTATDVLRDGRGTPRERADLLVTLLREQKIPARPATRLTPTTVEPGAEWFAMPQRTADETPIGQWRWQSASAAVETGAATMGAVMAEAGALEWIWECDAPTLWRIAEPTVVDCGAGEAGLAAAQTALAAFQTRGYVPHPFAPADSPTPHSPRYVVVVTEIAMAADDAASAGLSLDWQWPTTSSPPPPPPPSPSPSPSSQASPSVVAVTMAVVFRLHATGFRLQSPPTEALRSPRGIGAASIQIIAD